MRKLLITILMAVMTIPICACGLLPKNETPVEATPTPTPTDDEIIDSLIKATGDVFKNPEVYLDTKLNLVLNMDSTVESNDDKETESATAEYVLNLKIKNGIFNGICGIEILSSAERDLNGEKESTENTLNAWVDYRDGKQESYTYQEDAQAWVHYTTEDSFDDFKESIKGIKENEEMKPILNLLSLDTIKDITLNESEEEYTIYGELDVDRLYDAYTVVSITQSMFPTERPVDLLASINIPIIITFDKESMLLKEISAVINVDYREEDESVALKTSGTEIKVIVNKLNAETTLEVPQEIIDDAISPDDYENIMVERWQDENNPKTSSYKEKWEDLEKDVIANLVKEGYIITEADEFDIIASKKWTDALICMDGITFKLGQPASVLKNSEWKVDYTWTSQKYGLLPGETYSQYPLLRHSQFSEKDESLDRPIYIGAHLTNATDEAQFIKDCSIYSFFVSFKEDCKDDMVNEIVENIDLSVVGIRLGDSEEDIVETIGKPDTRTEGLYDEAHKVILKYVDDYKTLTIELRAGIVYSIKYEYALYQYQRDFKKKNK